MNNPMSATSLKRTSVVQRLQSVDAGHRTHAFGQVAVIVISYPPP